MRGLETVFLGAGKCSFFCDWKGARVAINPFAGNTQRTQELRQFQVFELGSICGNEGSGSPSEAAEAAETTRLMPPFPSQAASKGSFLRQLAVHVERGRALQRQIDLQQLCGLSQDGGVRRRI